ncbi:MAG: hypothetical protein H0X17_18525 [Deltaproteobacteria bacterium]|nr:hypothetical protein [Deltaproteobacteria bacterium]
MDYLLIILLICAGLLAASSIIVAKQPNARQIIDKLLPFQALIGAGTLVLGVLAILRWGPKAMIEMTKAFPLLGTTMWVVCLAGIVLGFMFAVPLMGRLGAGQQKAAELSAKLAPFQMLLGLVAIAAGLLMLLFRLGILPPNFPGSM